MQQHENMKQANKIMRSKKLTDVEKAKQLTDLGFKKEDLRYMEANGFPSYALANSNGRMKHTREKIAELQKLETREAQGKASKLLYEGADIKEDIPNKRVKLHFEEKPDAKMRAELKKKGFHWSPTNEAWQRKLTPDALKVAKEVMDTHYKKQFDTTTKKMMGC